MRHVVQQRLEAGIDVGNDGEQPRAGLDLCRAADGRLRRREPRLLARDLTEYPDYAEMLARRRRARRADQNAPQAISEVPTPISGRGQGVRTLRPLRRCSPQKVRRALHDRRLARHDRDHPARRPLRVAPALHDGAGAGDEEGVRADPRAGFVLQLDCPTSRWSTRASSSTTRWSEFRRGGAASRRSTGPPRGSPRTHPAARVLGQLRRPPHTRRALEAMLPLLYRARVGALSLPLANPRHQHEYKLIKRTPPPAEMLSCPASSIRRRTTSSTPRWWRTGSLRRWTRWATAPRRRLH